MSFFALLLMSCLLATAAMQGSGNSVATATTTGASAGKARDGSFSGSKVSSARDIHGSVEVTNKSGSRGPVSVSTAAANEEAAPSNNTWRAKMMSGFGRWVLLFMRCYAFITNRFVNQV